MRHPVVSADQVVPREASDSLVHLSAQTQRVDSAQATASVTVAEESEARVILSDELDAPPQ